MSVDFKMEWADVLAEGFYADRIVQTHDVEEMAKYVKDVSSAREALKKPMFKVFPNSIKCLHRLNRFYSWIEDMARQKKIMANEISFGVALRNTEMGDMGFFEWLRSKTLEELYMLHASMGGCF